MSNYAVRFLSMDARHEFNAVPGCPPEWPVAVDFIGEATESPFPNRIVMDGEELAFRRSEMADAFRVWHEGPWAAYVASREAAESAARNLIRDEVRQIMAQCKADYDNWATLTAAQKLELVRKLMRFNFLAFRE
jgi:hypothetical protein